MNTQYNAAVTALVGLMVVSVVHAAIRGIRIAPTSSTLVQTTDYMWISTNGSSGNSGEFSSPRTESDALLAGTSVIIYDRDSVTVEPPFDGTNWLDVVRYAVP